MTGSSTFSEYTPSILDRQNLTEGIVRQLIDSQDEVKNVLKTLIDLKIEYKVDEKGKYIFDDNGNKIIHNYRLGENSLINEKGLKRINSILTGFNNKNIGMGFRQPKEINLFILNNLKSFVIDLKENMYNWDVIYEDMFTIISVVESFLNAPVNKSYRGLGIKSIAGTVQSKESQTIQEQKKSGIGGLFGGGKQK